MALVTCPDCEAQISDAAPACINCGKPMSVSGPPTATAATLATSPQEKIFFDRNGVKVTSARFIVGTRTYAMQGVTSVKQAAKHPSRVLPIAFGIIGILLALDDKALIGTCLLVFAVLAWLLQKADWIVVLSSASGEQQALTSKDRAYIDAVISALNESLVYRG